VFPLIETSGRARRNMQYVGRESYRAVPDTMRFRQELRSHERGMAGSRANATTFLIEARDVLRRQWHLRRGEVVFEAEPACVASTPRDQASGANPMIRSKRSR
jgi:hypothetical protein